MKIKVKEGKKMFQKEKKEKMDQLALLAAKSLFFKATTIAVVDESKQ